MTRSLLIAGILALASGCATVEIHPGEHPEIPLGEGLVVLGFDASSLVYLHVMNESASKSFTVSPPIYRGENLRTFHVPPGRYCIEQMTCEISAFEIGKKACFEVEAGAATVTSFVEKGQRLVDHMPLDKVVAAFKTQHPELAEQFARVIEVELPLPAPEDYAALE